MSAERYKLMAVNRHHVMSTIRVASLIPLSASFSLHTYDAKKYDDQKMIFIVEGEYAIRLMEIQNPVFEKHEYFQLGAEGRLLCASTRTDFMGKAIPVRGLEFVYARNIMWMFCNNFSTIVASMFNSDTDTLVSEITRHDDRVSVFSQETEKLLSRIMALRYEALLPSMETHIEHEPFKPEKTGWATALGLSHSP